MAVNIEFSSGASKGNTLDSPDIHFIPCKIQHDGEANTKKFFKPYITEDRDEGQELKASFRGFPLSGCKMTVPEGYTGVVLKETRPTLSSEEERTMKTIHQFREFTYWNWDHKPSISDKYQQAMVWMELADVIHGDRNENSE